MKIERMINFGVFRTSELPSNWRGESCLHVPSIWETWYENMFGKSFLRVEQAFSLSF